MTDDKTPARLAAEELVEVRSIAKFTVVVQVKTPVIDFPEIRLLPDNAERIVAHVEAVIDRAIFAHIASVVPEGPVSEDRLGEVGAVAAQVIQRVRADGRDVTQGEALLVDAALALEHYRKLIARLIQDDNGACQAGREVGQREGVATEREACAAIADEIGRQRLGYATSVADLIRARGKKE